MDILLADRLRSYSLGHSIYSLEAFHSEIFALGGFEEFFEKNYGNQNGYLDDLSHGIISHRVKKMKIFHEAVDDPDRFNKSDLTHDLKKLNLLQVFNPFEKNKFKTGTDIIFHQWLMEAKKHGVDITEEHNRFIALQKKAFESIKKVEQHKRVIDTAIFKTFDLHQTFDTRANDNIRITNIIKHYSDNMDYLTVDSLCNLASTGGYGLLDLKNDFNDITMSIVQKIRQEQPYAYGSLAETYSQFLKNGTGPLTAFFTTKLDSAMEHNVELSKSQSIKRASLFVDGSVLFIDKNDQHIIPENSRELNQYITKFNLDLIDFKFRKQPVFGKIFKNKFLEDQDNINITLSTANSFLLNYDILKHIKFDKSILDKGFEEINDYIENSVKTYKVYKYANSILSSKNKHLMTESAYPFFEKFYDEKLKEDFLQDYIGKKLAMLTTPEEFTAFVKDVHDKLFDFGKYSTISLLDSIDKKAILLTDNECIVHIESFEESKKLGTNNWCISRERSYFDDYVKSDRRQYFFYDYTKESSDTMSMIGITLKDDGHIRAAHKKNDDSIVNHSSMQDLRLKIICLDYDFYKDNLDTYLKKEVEAELQQIERKKTKSLKNNSI
jgi:hypothetical protein